MADTPGPKDEVTPRAEKREPAPRWVKLLAIIGAVLVLLVAVLLLSGGNHGPGRHLGDGMTGVQIGPAQAGVASWR